MIQKCWHLDYHVRPTFLSLQKEKPWDEAKLALTKFTQDLKEKLMLHLFKGEGKTVPFGKFLRVLSKYLSEYKRLYLIDDIDGPFNSTPYLRTLIQAFNLSTGREHISKESVLLFLSWVSLTKKGNLRSNLLFIHLGFFFFGIMEQEEAFKIHSKSPKYGTYCIRWSNNQGSFVLDYIPKKKKNSLEIILPRVNSQKLRRSRWRI